jgi:hypothetical protein
MARFLSSGFPLGVACIVIGLGGQVKSTPLWRLRSGESGTTNRRGV